MASFPHLNNRHIELYPWNDFSILLSNFDYLCHILHTSHRLQDLSTYSDNMRAWDATDASLIIIISSLHKKGNFFIKFFFVAGLVLR